jgi:hypothetical protein
MFKLSSSSLAPGLNQNTGMNVIAQPSPIIVFFAPSSHEDSESCDTPLPTSSVSACPTTQLPLPFTFVAIQANLSVFLRDSAAPDIWHILTAADSMHLINPIFTKDYLFLATALPCSPDTRFSVWLPQIPPQKRILRHNSRDTSANCPAEPHHSRLPFLNSQNYSGFRRFQMILEIGSSKI